LSNDWEGIPHGFDHRVRTELWYTIIVFFDQNWGLLKKSVPAHSINFPQSIVELLENQRWTSTGHSNFEPFFNPILSPILSIDGGSSNCQPGQNAIFTPSLSKKCTVVQSPYGQLEFFIASLDAPWTSKIIFAAPGHFFVQNFYRFFMGSWYISGSNSPPC
jgi:hypothetical protein